ncbi:MAG: gluconeogenesis factor YvcK family protein [Roseiflexaceae bacterium]
MHVVIMGGGRGLIQTIRAIQPVAQRITVIEPSCNDTESDELIRRDGKYPAFAHMLQVMCTFGNNTSVVRVMQHRFNQLDSAYTKVPFGVLSVLAHAAHSSLPEALERFRQDVSCEIEVQLVSHTPHDMVCRVAETEHRRGISHIRQSPLGAIQQAFLDPPASASPAVLHALKVADVVLIAPGSLYEHVLPVLLPDGISETLQSVKGHVLCIPALTTVPGQTDTFRLADYVARVARTIGRGGLDRVVINPAYYPSDHANYLLKRGIKQLRYEESDAAVIHALGVQAVFRDMLNEPADAQRYNTASLTTHNETELRMACVLAIKESNTN